MQMVLAQGLRTTIDEHGVTQGILMFIVAAIMLAVLLPVLYGVGMAVPKLTVDPLAVGNTTIDGVYVIYTNTTFNTSGAGYGTLTREAGMVAAQSAANSTTASGYGLLVVVLVIVAASVILGAIGLFRYFGGQD